MNKIIKSRIIIFIVSILISYLLSDSYQNMLGFVLILSIGIIHGANDLLIIKKYSKKDTLRGTMSYFLYYLSFVLLGFIFFYLFPSVALLTFVLVSIYHFGEQHWEANKLSNQINIKNILSYKYINSFKNSAQDNIFDIAERLMNGLNQNEILLINKSSKNKGFFEKFFNFFS